MKAKTNPYNLGIPLTKEERFDLEVAKWLEKQKPGSLFLRWPEFYDKPMPIKFKEIIDDAPKGDGKPS